MRFSDNGYYVECYVKCDNCGVLIYGAGASRERTEDARGVFCSPWCEAWKTQKLAGVDMPVVPFGFDDA